MQGFEVVLETIEALLPQAAIAFEPIVNALQCGRFEPTGAPLRRAATRYQARVLQYLQVLGYGGPAYLERFCKLADCGLAQREARQSRARIARRVGSASAEKVALRRSADIWLPYLTR